VPIGQRARTGDEPRLLAICLGHRRTAAREQLFQPGEQLWIDRRPKVARGSDRFAGQVVGGRPQAAGRDHQVSAPQRSSKGVSDDDQVVR
jgi:hypothetical protein